VHRALGTDDALQHAINDAVKLLGLLSSINKQQYEIKTLE